MWNSDNRGENAGTEIQAVYIQIDPRNSIGDNLRNVIRLNVLPDGGIGFSLMLGTFPPHDETIVGTDIPTYTAPHSVVAGNIMEKTPPRKKKRTENNQYVLGTLSGRDRIL